MNVSRIDYSQKDASLLLYRVSHGAVTEPFWDMKERLTRLYKYCEAMLDRVEINHEKIKKAEQNAWQSEERIKSGAKEEKPPTISSHKLSKLVSECILAEDELRSYMKTLSSFSEALERAIHDAASLEASATSRIRSLMQSMQDYLDVRARINVGGCYCVPKINKLT